MNPLEFHAWSQVRLNGGQYSFEALGVARDYVALVEELVSASEIAHETTSFLNQ